MDTAISSLLIIGILILAIVGLSDRALSAQAVMAEASRALQARESERLRTALGVTDAAANPAGDLVQVTLHNTGATRLSDLERWDVIVEYGDGVSQQVDWLPYGVDINQWWANIYQDANGDLPEAFDPGVLNPGEDMVISINLSPPVTEGSTNRVTVVTPNGITASAVFAH